MAITSRQWLLRGTSLVAVVLLASCGLEPAAEEKEGEGGPFLALSDFASTSLRPLDSESVSSNLDGSLELQAAPEDEDDDDAASACDAVMNAAKIRATSDSIKVFIDVDLVECSRKNLADMNAESGTEGDGDRVDQATLKMYVELTCVGADLSIYDGKALNEVPDGKIDPCIDLGGTASTAVLHAESVIDTTYFIQNSAGGAKEPMRFYQESLDFTGASNSAGCGRKVEGDLVKSDGTCLNYRLERDKVDANSDFLTKFTKSGLSWKHKDLYFRSGTIGIDLNGWTGDMTYTSPTVAPTYTLKKGSDTFTGTYSPDHGGAQAPEGDPEDAQSQPTIDDDPMVDTTPFGPDEQDTQDAGIDTEPSTQNGDSGAGLMLTAPARHSRAHPRLPATVVRWFAPASH